ncbi:MAG: VIT domain-containing protein [Kofleriaceae bacterium]
MTDPKSAPEILERNVDSLLASADQPPRLDDDARRRMRAALLASVPARPRRRALLLAGLGAGALAAAAATVAVVVTRPPAPAREGVGAHRLADGTTAELRDGSALEVLGPRRVRLVGAALLDVVPGQGPFIVETAAGSVEVLGTRFLVEAEGDTTTAAVIRGAVALRGGAGEVKLGAGEGGRVTRGQPPVRQPIPRLSHLTSWAQTLREPRAGAGVPALAAPRGTLFARDPNATWRGEFPLPMTQLTLDVVVQNRVARVAIDHTFHNGADQVLEGTYRFAIPPDAALQRFAMYVDGRLTEAAVVERMRARRVYEDLVYVRQVDPALLEYAGVGKLEMRVYPLPPHQDKRIALAYTQTLPQLYDTWSLAVPLPKIDRPVDQVRFALHLADCANCEVVSPSHQIAVQRRGEDLEVSYRAERAELADTLLLTVRDRRDQPSVASFRDATGGYVQVRAPIALPRPAAAAARPAPRHWVVLNDVSASRGPVQRRAQAELLATLLGELDEDDRVAVLDFDVSTRELLPWTRVLDVDAAALARRLEEDDSGVGATDLGQALDVAAARLRASAAARPMILYLGDGEVTAGARQLDDLRARLTGGATFIGVGVGEGVDTLALGALAAASGGLVTTFDLSDDLRWRAFDLIATLNTPRVTNLTARLLDAEGQPIPGAMTRSPQLADGEELELVARLPAAKTQVNAVELTGSLEGAPWRQRVELAAARRDDQAGYAPRAWAQREIARLLLAKHEPVEVPPCGGEPCPSATELREQRDERLRKEIVELGKRFFLLSRHTSLIVLENDAMYAEYGVTKGSGQTWAPYALPAKLTTAKAPPVPPVPPVAPAPGAVVVRESWLGTEDFAATLAPVVASVVTDAERKALPREADKSLGPITAAGGTGLALERQRRARTADQSQLLGGEEAEAPFAEQPFASSSGHALIDGDDQDLGRFASGRVARATTGTRWPGDRSGYDPSPLGGAHPGFLGGRASLDDLSALIPALSRDALQRWSDALDILGPPTGGAAASDPAALAKLDRARAALDAGTYRWGALELSLDAQRHLRWRRELPSGLEETATFDGVLLTRRYPELGVAVTRTLTGPQLAALSLATFPLWVPPAEALAERFTLALAGDDQLTITAAGARRPTLTLIFEGDRLRAVRDEANHVLAEITWRHGAPVAARVDGRELTVSFFPAPAGAASARPASPASGADDVVVELPLRAPSRRAAELAATTPGTAPWRRASHQLLASLAAVGDPDAMAPVIKALAEAGRLRDGELALASGGLRALPQVLRRQLGGDDSAVAKHVRWWSAAIADGDAAALARPGGTGALPSLALVQQLAAKAAARDVAGALAMAASASGVAPMWRVAATNVLTPYATSKTTGAALAALWTNVGGPWANQGRYEAVDVLRRTVGVDVAQEALRAAIEQLDLRAAPPAANGLLERFYYQSSAGANAVKELAAAWRRRVLDGDSFEHAMALLPMLGYGSMEIVAVLDHAAQLAGTDQRRALTLARWASELGQPAWASAFLEPRLDGAPQLARLASELARRQGLPRQALRLLELALDTEGDATVQDHLQLLALSAEAASHTTAPQRAELLDKARRWARAVRAVAPAGSVDASMARLWLATGDEDQALRVLSSAIDRAPMSGEVWGSLAGQLEGLGRVADALAYWREAMILDQTNPTWRVAYARALLAAGRRDEAREILNEVVRRRWHARWEWVLYDARAVLRQARRR